MILHVGTLIIIISGSIAIAHWKYLFHISASVSLFSTDRVFQEMMVQLGQVFPTHIAMELRTVTNSHHLGESNKGLQHVTTLPGWPGKSWCQEPTLTLLHYQSWIIGLFLSANSESLLLGSRFFQKYCCGIFGVKILQKSIVVVKILQKILLWYCWGQDFTKKYCCGIFGVKILGKSIVVVFLG